MFLCRRIFGGVGAECCERRVRGSDGVGEESGGASEGDDTSDNMDSMADNQGCGLLHLEHLP